MISLHLNAFSYYLQETPGSKSLHHSQQTAMAAGAAAAGRQLSLAVAAACVLQLAMGAQLGLTADDLDTCKSALGMLRGCSPHMQEHDLQQHCCVPFYALEGLDCFWCEPNTYIILGGSLLSNDSCCSLVSALQCDMLPRVQPLHRSTINLWLPLLM